MRTLQSTLTLRQALKAHPGQTYEKISKIYAKQGSLERTAQRLGVPVRTLTRILEEHPGLRAMLDSGRKKPKTSNTSEDT